MSDLSLGQERIPICVVNELDKNSEAWAPPPVPLKPCKDEGKDPVEVIRGAVSLPPRPLLSLLLPPPTCSGRLPRRAGRQMADRPGGAKQGVCVHHQADHLQGYPKTNASAAPERCCPQGARLASGRVDFGSRAMFGPGAPSSLAPLCFGTLEVLLRTAEVERGGPAIQWDWKPAPARLLHLRAGAAGGRLPLPTAAPSLNLCGSRTHGRFQAPLPVLRPPT